MVRDVASQLAPAPLPRAVLGAPGGLAVCLRALPVWRCRSLSAVWLDALPPGCPAAHRRGSYGALQRSKSFGRGKTAPEVVRRWKWAVEGPGAWKKFSRLNRARGCPSARRAGCRPHPSNRSRGPVRWAGGEGLQKWRIGRLGGGGRWPDIFHIYPLPQTGPRMLSLLRSTRKQNQPVMTAF
jgi:hypothetical protein